MLLQQQQQQIATKAVATTIYRLPLAKTCNFNSGPKRINS